VTVGTLATVAGPAAASEAGTGVARPAPVAAASPPHGTCDPLDPARCLFPFPNDYFTVADPSTATGRRVDFQVAAMPRNQAGVAVDPTAWDRNDGFSPGSAALTFVPGLDLARTGAAPVTDIGSSLRPDSPIVLLDATTGRRVPFWAELDETAPGDDQRTLIVRPAVNFGEGHHVVVALRRLRDAGGATISAGSPFRVYRDRIRTPDAAVEARRPSLERLFATLARVGVGRSDLYLAWDFTVASEQSLTGTALWMRDNALAQLGDTTPGDGRVEGRAPQFTIDTCEVAVSPAPAGCTTTSSLDPSVYAHIAGDFTVPCYLDEIGCPPGSSFHYSSPTATLPTPIPGNTISANFECNVPVGAENGQTFRPMLVGHGLLGSADEINSAPYYAAGSYGLMACATDEIGMAEGDVSNVVAALEDISDFPSIPDRLQQGMIDFIYLGRDLINSGGFCASAAFRVGGRCVIDTSQLVYEGGSQGAIFGGALSAIDPDFTRVSLNVAGMDYALLLTRSTDFYPEFAQVMYTAYPNPLERQLLFSFMQDEWDHGEMDGYAENLTSSPLPGTPVHSVLMTVSFGDHQVTNWASEIEARTIGARLREPALDPGRYPGPTPYWGIPPIKSYPFTGRAAIVVGDLGPLRPCPNDGVTVCNGSLAGTPPPPLDNNPDTLGVDPHGPDWAASPEGIAAIAQWLAPNGFLPAVCGSDPCYMAGWTGPS
jgi:hypothetical protein